MKVYALKITASGSQGLESAYHTDLVWIVTCVCFQSLRPIRTSAPSSCTPSQTGWAHRVARMSPQVPWDKLFTSQNCLVVYSPSG